MNLKSENYRGIAIKIVQKIIGKYRVVSAVAFIKGKRFEVVGLSKIEVLSKIKRIIDRGGK